MKNCWRKKEHDHGSKLWLLASYSNGGDKVAEKGVRMERKKKVSRPPSIYTFWSCPNTKSETGVQGEDMIEKN